MYKALTVMGVVALFMVGGASSASAQPFAPRDIVFQARVTVNQATKSVNVAENHQWQAARAWRRAQRIGTIPARRHAMKLQRRAARTAGLAHQAVNQADRVTDRAIRITRRQLRRARHNGNWNLRWFRRRAMMARNLDARAEALKSHCGTIGGPAFPRPRPVPGPIVTPRPFPRPGPIAIQPGPKPGPILIKPGPRPGPIVIKPGPPVKPGPGNRPGNRRGGRFGNR